MSHVRINIKALIGTPNAIIQKQGLKVFEEAHTAVVDGKTVILDFAGIANLTSGFCNASVGKLYQVSPNSNVLFENINTNSLWSVKIEEAINLAKNPDQAKKIDDAILELFH